MFKAIKDEKIIAINETGNFSCLVYDEVVEDTGHTCDDYALTSDCSEYLLKEDIPEPTEEEQRKKREQAYTLEVDPITCHIDRLKDKEPTPEIEQEIAELKQERSEKVEDIKRRFPYPVENDPEYDVLVEG